MGGCTGKWREGGLADGRSRKKSPRSSKGRAADPTMTPPSPLPSTTVRTGRTGRALKRRAVRQSQGWSVSQESSIGRQSVVLEHVRRVDNEWFFADGGQRSHAKQGRRGSIGRRR